MQSIIVKTPGGPEVMELGISPDPVAGAGEVLIDVAAVGVNRADILQRQGHYPPPVGASEILGMEISGRIAEVGRGVANWAIGEQVCALLPGGGYAERVAVAADLLLPVPVHMNLISAAALPEALCTVYSNLVEVAGLSAGETILIHGGGSGIGTVAIQVARHLGARVACTAGSQPKLDRAAKLGAEILINYREADFAAVMRQAGGADVILDIMGAAYLSRNVAALRRGGRLIVIGLQGGRKGELNLAALLNKQGSIYGTTLRGLPQPDRARIVAGVREQLWPLVEDGKLRPVIDRVLPLGKAVDAHRLLERGAVTGKILLDVSEV